MAPSWQALAHSPHPLHFSSSIFIIFRIILWAPPLDLFIMESFYFVLESP
jgi:hypothetical protein